MRICRWLALALCAAVVLAAAPAWAQDVDRVVVVGVIAQTDDGFVLRADGKDHLLDNPELDGELGRKVRVKGFYITDETGRELLIIEEIEASVN